MGKKQKFHFEINLALEFQSENNNNKYFAVWCSCDLYALMPSVGRQMKHNKHADTHHACPTLSSLRNAAHRNSIGQFFLIETRFESHKCGCVTSHNTQFHIAHRFVIIDIVVASVTNFLSSMNGITKEMLKNIRHSILRKNDGKFYSANNGMWWCTTTSKIWRTKFHIDCKCAPEDNTNATLRSAAGKWAPTAKPQAKMRDNVFVLAKRYVVKLLFYFVWHIWRHNCTFQNRHKRSSPKQQQQSKWLERRISIFLVVFNWLSSFVYLP